MFVSQLVQRIQIQGIRNDRWFRVSYMPTRAKEEGEVNLDDIRAVFDGIEVGLITIVHAQSLINMYLVVVVAFTYIHLRCQLHLLLTGKLCSGEYREKI